MIRYFHSRDEVIEYLKKPDNLGVEQWIAWRVSDGFRFITWIRIVQESRPPAKEWCVYQKECLDVGSEIYIDMDEFEEVGDPDEPEGKRFVFDSASKALSHASLLGAKDNKYVLTGGIQYIYRDFFLEHGPPEKGIKQWLSPIDRCG